MSFDGGRRLDGFAVTVYVVWSLAASVAIRMMPAVDTTAMNKGLDGYKEITVNKRTIDSRIQLPPTRPVEISVQPQILRIHIKSLYGPWEGLSWGV